MQDVLTILKALSEEIRLRILKLLEKGELCVCDIVTALDMTQPKVSFHLAVLKDAGLIIDRRQGKWTHYRIDDSDLFIRFLLVTVLDRASGDIIGADRERLVAFLAAKSPKSVNLPRETACCGRGQDRSVHLESLPRRAGAPVE